MVFSLEVDDENIFHSSHRIFFNIAKIDPLTMISSFVVVAVMLFVETSPIDVTSRNPPTTTEGNCDPNVDMVFMLNGCASVPQEDFERQKNFVRDTIRSQNTPAGAVRVGLVVCSERNVTSIPFQKTKTDILASLDMLQKSSSVYDTSDTSHCIEHIHQMFRDIDQNRQHRSKLALLIIGKESHLSKEHATSLSKEMEVNRISLLVIGVGIQDFLTLHSLHNIASKSHRMFVLTSYLELQRIPKLFFSTNSCLSISLSLDSEYATSTVTPKTTIGTRKVTCRYSGDGSGYFKQVPFLGWQRQSCKEGEIIDILSCTCVTQKPATAFLKNVLKPEFLERRIDLTTLNPEVNKDTGRNMETAPGSNDIPLVNSSSINSTAVTIATTLVNTELTFEQTKSMLNETNVPLNSSNSTAVTIATTQVNTELTFEQTKSMLNETNVPLNSSNLPPSTIYTTLTTSTPSVDSEQQRLKLIKPP